MYSFKFNTNLEYEYCISVDYDSLEIAEYTDLYSLCGGILVYWIEFDLAYCIPDQIISPMGHPKSLYIC